MRIGKRVVKVVKYSGIGVAVILLAMFAIPYLFPGFVSDKIKKWANQAIETKLEFSKARLSFFNHFPSLTLTLYDVSLTGSAPFQNDTLVSANEIALGVDLSSVFSKTIHINEIYVTRGDVHILVNENGTPNYNIYKSSKQQSTAETDTSSTGATLKLDRIQIEDCALLYNDQSIPFLLSADKLNYLGKGKLSDAVFFLKSQISMENVDLQYDGEEYLSDKDLVANLRTRINTNSLELDFRKNDLKINRLPVAFTGVFYFLKNGYRMNFNASTGNTNLENLFTALPPAYVTWLSKTDVEGKLQMEASLKGDFIAAENRLPDLSFSMKVNNGSFTTRAVKQQLKNIDFDFLFSLPGLNTESMQLRIDTLHAEMGSDFISAAVNTKGLSQPHISGHINAVAELGNWSSVLDLHNLAGVDLTGALKMQAAMNGVYSPQHNKYPVINSSAQWSNGSLRTSYYSEPVTGIQLDVNLLNKKGTAQDMQVKIKPVSFLFEGQPFTLTADLNNFDNLVYNIRSDGNISIGKLYKLFAVEGYDVNGVIQTNLSLKGSQADATAGRYDKLSNKGTIGLKQISISTPYFPQRFIVNTGAFHINNDQLVADNLVLSYRNNTAVIKGSFSNIINYIMKSDAALHGNLSLSSKQLLVQEFMSTGQTGTIVQTASSKKTAPASTESSVIIIPANLDLQFHADVNKIDYNGLALYNWIADAAMQNGKFTISKSAFTVAGTPVNMEASYAPLNTKQAAFTYHVNAKEFDIQKAYKEIQLLRDLLTSASKVKGQISLDYTLNGLLNDSLYPVMKSLKGSGVISVKNPSFKGFKLFSAISKKTGKDAMESPDLSKQNIQLKTTIANNIITLERVKLKVAGFRPRFEGQVSLDGRLNLKARLGLPPFGIFGIPLTVTGTQENPVVRFRRGKNGSNLDEDADEEDKKEMEQSSDKGKQQ